jgi:glycosyltransferase involved in cell wall biosynthesis
MPEATDQKEISPELIKNYMHLLASRCYSRAKEYDIIHSHFNLISLFYSQLVGTPTVQSFHSGITEDQKAVLEQFKSSRFISFSLAQRKILPNLNWVANIYHGVDTKRFSFNPNPEDYFLCIGRLTKEKGIHLAIEAAKAANVPLRIAGRSYPNEPYWHDEIEPHIDGSMIRYIGEADFEKKVDLFRNAKALLMPVQWEEPFGMVMIEAMACGTPVIAFRRGSTPEVVSDRKTGYIVNDVTEMVQAIKKINKISRQQTRKRVEIYFSIEKMVNGYIKVYERVIAESQYKKENGFNHQIIKQLASYLKNFRR